MEDCVCREVMRLEAVAAEEFGKEVADGEAESALEVGEEDDEFAAPRLRLDLLPGSPAFDFGRDPATGVEPVDRLGRDIRPLPAAGRGLVVVLRVRFLLRVAVLF